MENKIENVSLIPQTVENARNRLNVHPRPRKGTFSVTELEKGSKELLLTRRHYDAISRELQEDEALIGNIVHDCMSREGKKLDDCLVEYRINAKATVFGAEDVTISGAIDLYDKKTKTLYDYKTCKVATFEREKSGQSNKWLYQTMSYRWLLSTKGFDVDNIVIVCFLLDYSAIKNDSSPLYPKHKIETIAYDKNYFRDPETGNPEIENQWLSYFTDKLSELAFIGDVTDNEIPDCTPSERFEDEKWAIMKKGCKRATCTCKSEEEANLVLEGYGEGYSIEHRPGNPIKCKLYCPVHEFCSFYKALIEQSNINSNEEE